MSTCKGKAGGKGGASKSKGGGGSELKITQKKMLTHADVVVKLRNALWTVDGKDRVDFGLHPMFMKYDKNGLALDINLTSKLEKDLPFAFRLAKESCEDIYDSSGYGWDDADKRDELSDKSCRFLVARHRDTGVLCAFAHFRFTQVGEAGDVQAGPPCCYVYDLHVAPAVRRKGLGLHLLTLLTLITKAVPLKLLLLHVCDTDTDAQRFLQSPKLKAGPFKVYSSEVDDALAGEGGGPAAMHLASDYCDGFKLWGKIIDLPPPPAVAAPAAATTPVKASAEVPSSKAESPTAVADVASLPMESLTVDDDTKKKVAVAGASAAAVAPPPAPVLQPFDMTGQASMAEFESDEDESLEDPALEKEEELSEEDELLESLIEEFQARNGRDPTKEEVMGWMAVLKEAAEAANQPVREPESN